MFTVNALYKLLTYLLLVNSPGWFKLSRRQKWNCCTSETNSTETLWILSTCIEWEVTLYWVYSL